MRWTVKIHLHSRSAFIKRPIKSPKPLLTPGSVNFLLSLFFFSASPPTQNMVHSAFHYKDSEKMVEEKKKIKPQWLELFLSNRFFAICEEHKEMKKNEINIYCIECNLCMCSRCTTEDLSHRCHLCLQIRRYVYQDVVRIIDIQKLIDCSKIQTYIVNKAKVVLLNAKEQSKPSKVPLRSASCKICCRAIFEPNRYCSIGCKFSDESVEISNPYCKSGPFIAPMTPDLDDLNPAEDDSASSLSSSQPSDSVEENADRWMDEKPPVTLKRGASRRKGVPHRSPMF